MKDKIGMTDNRVRIFATADIGSEALARLRRRGYETEVYTDYEGDPSQMPYVVNKEAFIQGKRQKAKGKNQK